MKTFAPNLTDVYKLGHPKQYYEGTNLVVSNFTPRNFSYARRVGGDDVPEYMMFFGLQYAIKEYLINSWKDSFFNQNRDKVISKYTRRVANTIGKGNEEFVVNCMEELWYLGYLPIEIKALPEGAHVPAGVPLFTVENTDPEFYWLTNYIETILSCVVWPMCNAASLSEQYYILSKNYGLVTGASEEYWLPFANHNFSMRGMRGLEDAVISGAAHLLFSLGTDTTPAIDFLEDYYNAVSDVAPIGVSVNATEHATTTQLIKYFGSEEKSLEHIITHLYPSGIVSYVADSEDYFKVIAEILPKLKDKILARTPDRNGIPPCLTIRPDSSPKTPLEIIVGDQFAIRDSYEYFGTLELLWNTFGGTIVTGSTGKQYKLLDSHVRIIYGEAISLEMAEMIYSRMERLGWCVGNVFFGVGSWAFLESSSRDSYGLAMKATYSEINGVPYELQKTPKTSSFKKSHKGLLRVEKDPVKGYVVYDQQTKKQAASGELKTVFKDGILIKDCNFEDIRKLAKGV
jgi:nicotinamide phosphoribosyltransferase